MTLWLPNHMPQLTSTLHCLDPQPITSNYSNSSNHSNYSNLVQRYPTPSNAIQLPRPLSLPPMIISYQWLLEYLPQPLPVEELGRILTSIGLEVEAIEKAEAIKGGLEGLVIGEVLTAATHPNADKLKITTVNIGTGTPLNIVCGAPNVAAGQRVVVAPVGATVHPTEGEPFLIKKAKIRGEESAGMICA